MGKVRILYYGGLWPTNIGNAFIDVGTLYLLKQSCPQAIIHIASRFSRFYAQHRSERRLRLLRNEWRPLDIAEHAKVDFVVVAGNVTHTDFIKVEGPAIRSLVKRGAKFVIIGGGCSTYTRHEVDAFKKFMRSIQTYVFVSRDQTSYDALKDAAQVSHPGIDSAFFVSDAIVPIPLNLQDYVVCIFDNQELENKLDFGDKIVVRARHYSFGVREQFKRKLDDTLISDLPYDYISLYAGAEAVHSDRVHACVVALAFGRKARLYSSTPRARLFNEVGAGNITIRLVEAEQELLMKRKEEELKFLSSIFNCPPRKYRL